MHKVITFGIPSYNAAKDMDHCITSILEGSNYATDIEIIVVDDGSKDETVPLDNVFDWALPLDLPVVVVPGADHFFHRRLHVIRDIITRAWRH